MGKLREEYLRLNIAVNGDPARKEIGDLTRHAKNLRLENERLREEQKKLRAAGGQNKARIEEITATIEKNNQVIKANEARAKQLRSELKVTSMTTAELNQRNRELRAAMRYAVPGTPQWRNLRNELQAVANRMAQLKAETASTQSAMRGMATRVNRYIGTVTAAFAAATMYASGFRKAIQSYSELDEAMSNARKTTGMTRQEVEELNEQLAGIDTRTAQNELLALARIGGKLGIAKQDIEGFVRAADIIKISLGRDLGDDVETTIGQIGKLVNVFHINREFGIEQGMMKAAAAVNELGKSSTANEANIVEFMRRVGGVGSAAKISLANIAGLGSTLDNLGVTMEVAGTSMSQVITGMYRRTDAFAAAAKMSVRDFRRLMDEDMNEALLRMAEGMGSDGAAMSKIVAALDALKLDGQRATGVLTNLAQNTEMVREQQLIANKAFEEGTSCLKEFNIMNNTTEAITEKLKKRITEEAAALGKSLVPAYHESLSAKAALIQYTRVLVEWLIRHRGLIFGLIATYAAYKTALFTITAVKKGYITIIGALRGMKLSYLLAVRSVTVATITETGATKAATIATRALGIALKATPLGWFAMAAGLAVGAITYFANRTSAATRAQKALKEVTAAAAEVTDEHGVSLVGKAEKLSQLMRVTEDTTTSEKRRTAAIKELQELMPGGIALINEETIANGKAAQSVRNYTEVLLLQATIKAAIQKKEEEIEKAAKKRLEGEDTKVSWGKRQLLRIGAFASIGAPDYDQLLQMERERKQRKFQKDLDDSIAPLDQIIADTQAKLDALRLTMPAPQWDYEQDADFIESKTKLEERFRAGKIASEKEFNKELLQLEIDTLQRRLAANIDTEEELTTLQEQVNSKRAALKRLDEDGYTPVGEDTKKKWSLDNDAAFLAEKQKLRQQYADGEITTEQQYQDRLLALEIAALQTRLAANKEAGAERSKLEIQLADKMVEQKKREQQAADEAEDLRIQNMTDATERENAEYERRKKKHAGNAAALEQLERQHERNLTKIQFQKIEAAITVEEDAYKRQRLNLRREQAAEMLAFTGTAEEKKRLKKKHNEELAELDIRHAQEMSDKLKELLDKGNFEGLSIDTSLLTEEQKNKLIQMLVQVQDQIISLGVEADNLRKKGDLNVFGADILGFSKDDWEILIAHLEDGQIGVQEIAMAMKAMTNLYATYDQLVSASENRQLKQFKKNNDAKKKALDRRLQQGSISQEQYNARVEQMDAEYEAKQEEIQIKQARRQKAMSIIDAIINTAVGVTAANRVPLIGPILAAMVAAMGAAQIALIAAQPIPGAVAGGVLVTRAQDGRRFRSSVEPDKRGYVDRPTVLVGENGMEYVIPAEAMDNPTARPIIDVFEAVRRQGRLRDFDFGKILPAFYPVGGRNSGGLVTTSPMNVLGVNTPVHTDTQKIIEYLEYLCKKADEPTPAIVTLMGSGGFLEAYRKYTKLKKFGQLG